MPARIAVGRVIGSDGNGDSGMQQGLQSRVDRLEDVFLAPRITIMCAQVGRLHMHEHHVGTLQFLQRGTELGRKVGIQVSGKPGIFDHGETQ